MWPKKSRINQMERGKRINNFPIAYHIPASFPQIMDKM